MTAQTVTQTTPDRVTSVVALHPKALTGPSAAGALEETITVVIHQLAQTARNMRTPVDWGTFRMRVENPSTATGTGHPMIDAGTRVRATVDVVTL